jgi:hypothetical protein
MLALRNVRICREGLASRGVLVGPLNLYDLARRLVHHPASS